MNLYYKVKYSQIRLGIIFGVVAISMKVFVTKNKAFFWIPTALKKLFMYLPGHMNPYHQQIEKVMAMVFFWK